MAKLNTFEGEQNNMNVYMRQMIASITAKDKEDSISIKLHKICKQKVDNNHEH